MHIYIYTTETVLFVRKKIQFKGRKLKEGQKDKRKEGIKWIADKY